MSEKRLDSGLVALAVGMAGSGAANVTWAWQAGPVHVVAGIFATALVPTSLHLWPRVPITGGKSRAIRAVVMTYICAAAAAVNLSHATLLLTHLQAPSWLAVLNAVLLITAIEAVMVMASLARRAAPRQTKRSPVRKSAEQRTASLPAEQSPAAAPVEVSDVAADQPGDDDRAALIARAREIQAARRAANERPLGRAKLAEALGTTTAVARAVLEEIDESPVRLVVNA